MNRNRIFPQKSLTVGIILLASVVLVAVVPLSGISTTLTDPRSLSDLRDNVIQIDNGYWPTGQQSEDGPLSKGEQMLNTYAPWLSLDTELEARHLANQPISAWLEAAYLVHFYSLEPAIYRQAKLLFSELELRQATSTLEARQIAEMSIGARDFDFANHIIDRYPALGLGSVPALNFSASFDSDQPAVMKLVDPALGFEVENVVLDDEEYRLVFVFHPNCGFSRRAVEQLESMAHFDCFKGSQGLWIAPMHFRDESPDIRMWNEQNPDSAVHPAYRNVAWQPITLDQTPQFYLLQGRDVLMRHVGWRSEESPGALVEVLDAFLSLTGKENCWLKSD